MDQEFVVLERTDRWIGDSDLIGGAGDWAAGGPGPGLEEPDETDPEAKIEYNRKSKEYVVIYYALFPLIYLYNHSTILKWLMINKRILVNYAWCILLVIAIFK